MKEAMQQVKEELGPDAVILHTKKYREGGFLGYHSTEVVEVTAAIEDQEEKRTPKRAKQNGAGKAGKTEKKDTSGQTLDILSPAAPVMPTQVLSQYKTNGTEAGVRLAESPVIPIPAPAFQPVSAAQPAIPAKPVAAPEPKDKADDMTQQKVVTSNPEDAEKIHKLEDELAQMKTLLAQVMSKDQPKDKISIQEALRRQEVDEDILKNMAAQLPAGDTLLDSLDNRAVGVLAEYLGKAMQFSEGITLNKHGVRIVALIGATGVGKTTTLAKIAARFVLERHIRVALITADTYRISAVEQLKTYSDIIGLPLDIVYTPDELKTAIHKHRDKDLILIDTAGRSQHNEYQMKELQEFLAVHSHIERHLVMSATTKNRDAADILEKFSVCNPDRVIFTKTDETSSVGIILNLLAGKEISLSFLTNGQSVPDDIVPATPRNLAELLLRE